MASTNTDTVETREDARTTRGNGKIGAPVRRNLIAANGVQGIYEHLPLSISIDSGPWEPMRSSTIYDVQDLPHNHRPTLETLRRKARAPSGSEPPRSAETLSNRLPSSIQSYPRTQRVVYAITGVQGAYLRSAVAPDSGEQQDTPALCPASVISVVPSPTRRAFPPSRLFPLAILQEQASPGQVRLNSSLRAAPTAQLFLKTWCDEESLYIR